MSDLIKNLIKQRREILKTSGGKLPRRRKPPSQLHPKGIEREYYSAILRLINPVFDEINERLLPKISEIITAYEQETRVDSRAKKLDTYGEIITHAIDGIRVGITLRITDTDVRDTSDKFARRVNLFNEAQVDNQFETVLGIPVLRAENWLEPQIDAFTERNVSLIKSIPEEFLSKVEQMVRHSVEQGVLTRKLTKQIRQSFKIPKQRAKLIARDQISKFNGKLNELRQTEAGVKEYDWSASKDERVRERHKWADGKRFKWSDPPAVGQGGEKLHPGQDYQCRCTALPILDEFLK